VPIRELALIAIVAIICLVAIVRPQYGLYGYIWFAIVQPDVMAWCEGKYPFSLALALATLIGSIRFLYNLPRLLRNPFVQGILLLQIPIGISIVLSEGPFLSPDRYSNFERTTVMILLIPLLLETTRDMLRLIYTFAISEAMLGARFGAFGLVSGGALLNQPYGHLYDNNELALAIAMLIPVCWYCRAVVTHRWAKLALVPVILLSCAAVILTNSRGASIALGMVLLCLILRSQRKVAMLVLVALAVGPTVYIVHDRYFARMATIRDYENEQSAATRVELWGVAIQMWADFPVFGVGFGNRNFAILAGHYLKRPNLTVAHNSYLQMLVDSGILAFLLYSGLLFGSIVWLHRSARALRKRTDGLANVPLGLQTALIAYAGGATFYSHQRYDLMYILVMTVAAWRQIQETLLAPQERSSSQPGANLAEVASAGVRP